MCTCSPQSTADMYVNPLSLQQAAIWGLLTSMASQFQRPGLPLSRRCPAHSCCLRAAYVSTIRRGASLLQTAAPTLALLTCSNPATILLSKHTPCHIFSAKVICPASASARVHSQCKCASHAEQTLLLACHDAISGADTLPLYQRVHLYGCWRGLPVLTRQPKPPEQARMSVAEWTSGSAHSELRCSVMLHSAVLRLPSSCLAATA